MRLFTRAVWLPALLMLATLSGACQSPTSTDTNTLDVDDFVDASVTPNPVVASAPDDGKTYRVVRGNNQPDDILAYDWKATFTVRVTINSNADDDDVELDWPATITAATARVEQASGGIVSPPTAGDSEHYESLIVQSSGNSFGSANTSQSLTFDVWYDLPSLRKEALIIVSIGFKDDDGGTFTKTVTVQVSP